MRRRAARRRVPVIAATADATSARMSTFHEPNHLRSARPTLSICVASAGVSRARHRRSCARSMRVDVKVNDASGFVDGTAAASTGAVVAS